LLLNQSYEPLTICTLRKAVILIILQKAEIISHKEGKKIGSINFSMKWPSVVRLKRYIRTPYKKIILSRKNIIKRDGFKCAYCGKGNVPLTMDHIQPKSKGGEDTWENLIAACTKCNNKKGDRTPDEANMRLLHKPFKPDHVAIMRNSVNRIDESWKPFLYMGNK